MVYVCSKQPFLFKPFVSFWMSMTFHPGVDSIVHWGSVMKYFKGNCSGLKLVRSKRMQTNKSYNCRTKQPQNLVLCEMQSSETALILARPINWVPVSKSLQKQEKSFNCKCII